MRPEIICHMLSSVDGRLVCERWTPPFDGKQREELYEPYFEMSLAQGAQAWMVGRKTIQADNPTGTFDYQNYGPAKRFETFRGKRETERSCIVIDPKGKILYPDERIAGDNVITILGKTVSDEYLGTLRDRGISYIFAGEEGNELETALETLYNEFGIRKIMLSGGGIINGTFLKAGLIDELLLMVYPGIDSLTGAPAIFEYPGRSDDLPAAGQALELLSVQTMRDGIVTLHYKFHKI